EEEPSAEALHGEWVNLAEEDAARVQLMAAKLGHEPTTGPVVKTPANQLLEVLITIRGRRLLPEFVVVHLVNGRIPAVAQSWLRHAFGESRAVLRVALRRPRPGEIAMPEGTDVLDVAQDIGLDHVACVGIDHAVM